MPVYRSRKRIKLHSRERQKNLLRKILARRHTANERRRLRWCSRYRWCLLFSNTSSRRVATTTGDGAAIWRASASRSPAGFDGRSTRAARYVHSRPPDSFVVAIGHFHRLLVSALTATAGWVQLVSLVIESAHDARIAQQAAGSSQDLRAGEEGSEPLTKREDRRPGTRRPRTRTPKSVSDFLSPPRWPVKVHVRHILEKLGRQEPGPGSLIGRQHS